MKQLSFLVFLLLNGFFSESSWAHGSKITYTQTSAIAIEARFEDGTPMVNAQAIVYSPQDPATPWLTGITDESGQFNFVPDSRLSGNWAVKIRQSGHGDIVSIPVVEGRIVSGLEDEPNIISETKEPLDSTEAQVPLDISETRVVSSKQDFTPWQKLMMTVTSVWGFIGTAFFFSRNQKSSTNN